MTPEEYLQFEAASPIRHEYVAGEVYAMTGAVPQHNLISIALVSEFRNHLRGGPCRAFMAEVKAHIKSSRDEAYYYPDVMVACGGDALEKPYLQDPKLIVEVLSPSTARHRPPRESDELLADPRTAGIRARRAGPATK